VDCRLIHMSLPRPDKTLFPIVFLRVAAAALLGALAPARATSATTYPVGPAFGGIAFQQPVQVVFAPGETTRAFVVERGGTIAMVADINNPVRQVILDLSASVNPPANDSGHGMLSMVFHPKFAQNGYFYVWTSIWDSGGNRYTRLIRFTLSPTNTVDPSSALTLINQPVGSGGHDGGTLLFGTDGYLYLSIGDGDEGVAGAEAIASHQRIDEGFFGAVLRIDVDQNAGNLPPNPHLGQQPTGYLIPADNPFVGATSFNGQPVNPSSVRTEFWAVGFRNPFRMSFDSSNGELWVGDVGLNTQEEIDIVTRGANYGWNFYEGTAEGPDFAALPAGITFTPPVWDYTHDDGDLCIIGGLLYHGAAFPQLQGQYIFGDYISGRIWAASSPSTRPFQDSQVAEIASTIGVTNITVQPGTGAILIANLNSGVIQQLGAPSASATPPIISSQPDSQTVSGGSTVVFGVTASAAPAASYQWFLDGVPVTGATSAILVLAGANSSDAGTYTCTVTNSAGSVESAPASLSVDASAPPPRLIDISTRGLVGTGSNVLIAGFIVGGTTSKTVLIRASGPAIGAAPYNVPGTLPDPQLQLYGQGSPAPLLATNAGWSGNPQVSAEAAAVGAFPWTDPSSKDSALLISLPPGAYTAQVSGASGDTGVALVEVYDVP
jgi:glucose/arabinose dehydrogenase